MLGEYESEGEPEKTVENKMGGTDDSGNTCRFSKFTYMNEVYADRFQQTE
tara:strand:+ start:2052 stop:2201 length:150 start_codon:yes stop_codon:yes gene_type:complete